MKKLIHASVKVVSGYRRIEICLLLKLSKKSVRDKHNPKI